MTTCKAKVCTTKSKKFCIELVTPDRSYWMAADDNETMHTWIWNIQEACQLSFENISIPKLDFKNTINDYDDNDDNGGIKQGNLLKMGNNVIKDWNKRWVMMNPDKIEYFRNKLDFEPAGTIYLSSAQIIESNIRPFCMEIITPTRSFWFCGTNSKETNEWIQAISNNIQKIHHSISEAQKDTFLVIIIIITLIFINFYFIESKI